MNDREVPCNRAVLSQQRRFCFRPWPDVPQEHRGLRDELYRCLTGKDTLEAFPCITYAELQGWLKDNLENPLRHWDGNEFIPGAAPLTLLQIWDVMDEVWENW